MSKECEDKTKPLVWKHERSYSWTHQVVLHFLVCLMSIDSVDRHAWQTFRHVFSKGDKLCDFLFAFQCTPSSVKKAAYLKREKKKCSQERKLFPFKVGYDTQKGKQKHSRLRCLPCKCIHSTLHIAFSFYSLLSELRMHKVESYLNLDSAFVFSSKTVLSQ